jgi:hypothetical protein
MNLTQNSKLQIIVFFLSNLNRFFLSNNFEGIAKLAIKKCFLGEACVAGGLFGPQKSLFGR